MVRNSIFGSVLKFQLKYPGLWYLSNHVILARSTQDITFRRGVSSEMGLSYLCRCKNMPCGTNQQAVATKGMTEVTTMLLQASILNTSCVFGVKSVADHVFTANNNIAFLILCNAICTFGHGIIASIGLHIQSFFSVLLNQIPCISANQTLFLFVAERPVNFVVGVPGRLDPPFNAVVYMVYTSTGNWRHKCFHRCFG